MKWKIASLALILAVLGAFVVAPLGAEAKKAASPLSVPVTGTTDDGGTFAGTFDVTRFSKKHGAIAAVGTLTGTLTDATGGTQDVSDRVTLPVTDLAGTCEILDLTLGPLDLDLLGLVVHLDTVHLNITAEPGPGNLLGNLLCAVAGLLDGGIGVGGALNQIVHLLNQILGAL